MFDIVQKIEFTHIVRTIVLRVMSVLTEMFWAESSWTEKLKLTEKYFIEISMIGDHF
jgi:hypothetical protein